MPTTLEFNPKTVQYPDQPLEMGNIDILVYDYWEATISRLSLSTVVLIVGIGRKLYGFGKNSCFKNQPCNRLYPKNQLECIGKAVMMLYLG